MTEDVKLSIYHRLIVAIRSELSEELREVDAQIERIVVAAEEWEVARTEAIRIAEATGGKSENFDHITRLGNAECELKDAVRASRAAPAAAGN